MLAAPHGILGNIDDHITADFVFANGARMSSHCRQLPDPKMYRNVSEMVIGTKGRSNCHDLGSQGERDYVAEHTALINLFRGTGPYINHATAVAESTMTCIMARESSLFGARDDLGDDHEFAVDRAPKNFGDKEAMPLTPLPVRACISSSSLIGNDQYSAALLGLWGVLDLFDALKRNPQWDQYRIEETLARISALGGGAPGERESDRICL